MPPVGLKSATAAANAAPPAGRAFSFARKSPAGSIAARPGSAPPARRAIQTSASAAKSRPKASAPEGRTSARFATHAASSSHRAGAARGVPSLGEAARKARPIAGAPRPAASARRTRPPRECVTTSTRAPDSERAKFLHVVAGGEADGEVIEGVDVPPVRRGERVEGGGRPREVEEGGGRVREGPVDEEEALAGRRRQGAADARRDERGAPAREPHEAERRAGRREPALLPRAREDGERRAGGGPHDPEEKERHDPGHAPARGRRERDFEDVGPARDGERPVERERAGGVSRDEDEAVRHGALDGRRREAGPAGAPRRGRTRAAPARTSRRRREGAREERVRRRGLGRRPAGRRAHDLPAGGRRETEADGRHARV